MTTTTPDTASTPFNMTLSLNVLNHLGINLYSNIAAVLSEVVANAWDADAENVEIVFDATNKIITIADDGHGMTLDDINEKFLNVGYRRRDNEEEATTPKFERAVMGRKGIGKLSLFSIAKRIEVHTVRDDQCNGFVMNLDEIKAKIKEREATYHPTPLESAPTDLKKGTRIVISELKHKTLHQTPAALRKRLARRFSVIGDEFNFAIKVNGEPVTIMDRDYFHKVQYLWLYGEDPEVYKKLCDKQEVIKVRTNEIADEDGEPLPYRIRGWIGSVKQSGDLKDGKENLNKIVVMVRGKLAQEDILEDYSEGGIYSKYLMGEVHADFLDSDDDEDIATSSRQRIIEDDERYQALQRFIYGELKAIQNAWTKQRNDQGVKTALEVPAIEKWFKGLPRDQRHHAESLFGKINQLTIDSEDEKKALMKHSILAFENFRYKQNLNALEKVSPDNLKVFAEVVAELDDIEATMYHQIVKERLGVIDAIQKKVEENALEKVVQQFLFDHLWLLDPSWERATGTEYMEQRVSKEFGAIDAKLSDDEQKGRLDIKYRTTSGKHIIIELKRPERVVSTSELLEQGRKYRNGLHKILREIGQDDEPIEVVCVVGKELSDWSDINGREESAASLKAKGIRVVMYQELLQNAQKAYKAYIDNRKEAGRIFELIQSLEAGEFGDTAAVAPESPTAAGDTTAAAVIPAVAPLAPEA